MDWLTFFQIVLGAFISAVLASVFVMWVEFLRKPKLTLNIGKPTKHEYDKNAGKPARIMRKCELYLKNSDLPRCLRWMSRNAAVHCYGHITFYAGDGKVLSRPMPIKWSRMPRLEVHPGGTMAEHSLYEVSYMDVHPGEEESLAVIARFDNESACYGWNNDSYYSDWRNKDWELKGPGDYFVKVKVISAGIRCEDIFKLHIGQQPDDFQLKPTDRKDKDKILKIPVILEE